MNQSGVKPVEMLQSRTAAGMHNPVPLMPDGWGGWFYKPWGIMDLSKHAELCPVCKGSGKYAIEGPLCTTVEHVCHGCTGKGWVTV